MHEGLCLDLITQGKVDEPAGSCRPITPSVKYETDTWGSWKLVDQQAWRGQEWMLDPVSDKMEGFH